MKKLGIALVVAGALAIAGGATGITYSIVNHDDMQGNMKQHDQGHFQGRMDHQGPGMMGGRGHEHGPGVGPGQLQGKVQIQQ